MLANVFEKQFKAPDVRLHEPRVRRMTFPRLSMLGRLFPRLSLLGTTVPHDSSRLPHMHRPSNLCIDAIGGNAEILPISCRPR